MGSNGSFGAEGFAQPWLNFENQIGTRLLLHGPTPAEAEEQFNSFGPILIKHLTFPAPDTTVTTVDKEISPGLKVRIYTPPNYISSSKPGAVFYHGGGWTMGDLDGEDAQVRLASKNSGIVIVSVDYCLAPANPFPKPLNDCVKAYYWVLENSEFLKTSSGKVVAFGTSAGANLAIATALRVIEDQNGDSLKGVVAIVPPTIAPEAVPEQLKERYLSMEEHAEHTVNTQKAMKMFSDAYRANSKDPYFSVLLHTKLEQLPKVYTAVCGHDTLRDDGRLFKEALDEAGVPNLFDEYQGYPHWFWAYPSEHLKEPVDIFFNNLKKGFEFVLET